MTKSSYNNSQLIGAIKEYIAPILLSIVGLFIWRDITEMRGDIKLLLVQQSADKVKIESMQSDISMLKAVVFNKDVNKDKETNYVFQPAKKEDELEIKQK